MIGEIERKRTNRGSKDHITVEKTEQRYGAGLVQGAGAGKTPHMEIFWASLS